MTEKEFKKIITDIDNVSLNKQKVTELTNNVIDQIKQNLHQQIKIKEQEKTNKREKTLKENKMIKSYKKSK